MFSGYQVREEYEDELYGDEEHADDSEPDSDLEFQLYSQLHYATHGLENNPENQESSSYETPQKTQPNCKVQPSAGPPDEVILIDSGPDVITLSDNTEEEDSVCARKGQRSKSKEVDSALPPQHHLQVEDAHNEVVVLDSDSDQSSDSESVLPYVVYSDSDSDSDLLEGWMILGREKEEGDQDIQLNVFGVRSRDHSAFTNVEGDEQNWVVSDKDKETLAGPPVQSLHPDAHRSPAYCYNCSRKGHFGHGPKSSFITPEKRAKLKSNPVKVRFAEEVVVNGHSQGNSLLFLPNVLKVYLENGQTKAFKFEPKTTVKDIVMTLKEKLSISLIKHFSLVLEQQFSISKLFLLHEDELIQESVSDVLQERFAVEMKCNTALRLAALNIQERLASTGQSPKTSLKTIVKDWGFESFVSNTLLRNMREKDLRKAVNLHNKRIVLQEHKHKIMTVNQTRLNYLREMSELKSFGGKSFTATMMLQDRESTVSLLVGAQYGVSQVINHKLSIMTTLAEFTSITRVELGTESERVSLVKIYMEDIKPMTLLLETVPAKDLACLIAGYCKVFIDPQICVFPWVDEARNHRISAEEGYVSRCCSDSEDSEVDTLLVHATSPTQTESTISLVNDQVVGQKNEKNMTEEKEGLEDKSEKESVENRAVKTKKGSVEEAVEQAESVNADEGETEKPLAENDTAGSKQGEQEARKKEPPCVIIVEDPPSEASDSIHTDSHFVTSMSSDSMDALEEDDFLTYFSTNYVSQLNGKDHYLHADTHTPCPSQPECQYGDFNDKLFTTEFSANDDKFICFAALSNIADCLPSPTEASEEEYSDQEGEEDEQDAPEDVFESVEPVHGECVFSFNQGNAQCYYNLCANVTPDSGLVQGTSPRSHSRNISCLYQEMEQRTEPASIVLPPPGFGDSSTDDEFFDAQEKFLTEEPLSAPTLKEHFRDLSVKKRTLSLSNMGVGVRERRKREGESKQREKKHKEKMKTETKNELPRFRKKSRKRRSFMETEFTSLVTFPEKDQATIHLCEDNLSDTLNQSSCPTVSSVTNAGGEPEKMESKPVTPFKPSESGTHHLLHGKKISKADQRKQQVILMEPDSMEFKSVTEIMSTASPAIVAIRTSTEPKVKVSAMSDVDGLEEKGAVGGTVERLLDGHLFFGTPNTMDYSDESSHDINDQETLVKVPLKEPLLLRKKSRSLPHLNQTPASGSLSLKKPSICFNQQPGMDRLTVESQEMGIQKYSTKPTRSQSLPAVADIKGFLCLTGDPLPQRKYVGCTKEPHSGYTERSGDLFIQNSCSTLSVGWLTQGHVLSPCPSGIIGPLSVSTLREKIQNLPLYLSRSQEMLASNDSLSNDTKPSRRVSKEMTTIEVKSDTLIKVFKEVEKEVFNSTEPKELFCPPKSPSSLNTVDPDKISPLSHVVTTQNITKQWGIVTSQENSKLQAGNYPIVGCHIQPLIDYECKPTSTQPQALSSPNLHAKPDITCTSALASVCETVIESAETPMEVCGCQSAYTTCFSSVLESANFDDELTVYEFSRRTQQNVRDRVALVTSVPPSSLSCSSSSFSPSSPLPTLPRVVLPPTLPTELGPLLSPLDIPDCFLSEPYGDAITTLLAQHYPLPPTGFLTLQRDVSTLLTVLDDAMKDPDCIQEHPRDTCADHFSENKRRLHVEARGFLAGCQQVVKAGQTPAETLQALADSFHLLVELTAVCLSFSSCQRCQERHTETLSALADVVQTYQEFTRAAERLGMATERRTCHELSIKLLARQCTALTTSVFCLTQLFRTLTAL
ncbi:FERM and PDZ domain-containing protein 1 [Bagarius yarrelli]|uniref:FERM and PDZ domain-containing protein 1 n=1 Tax=Bagarius yarrelli TaxID=175774 RepID=A0A556U8F4_BAGYA|nr:FERM and PDZ domain-containing protein 1 [Bagarius yarrelli]